MSSFVKLFDSISQLKSKLEEKLPKKIKFQDKEFGIVLFNGEIKIYDNECPHMKVPLSGGHINHLGQIICPLHHYKFSLHTGEEEDQKCDRLKIYNVKNTEGALFLELD